MLFPKVLILKSYATLIINSCSILHVVNIIIAWPLLKFKGTPIIFFFGVRTNFEETHKILAAKFSELNKY